MSANEREAEMERQRDTKTERRESEEMPCDMGVVQESWNPWSWRYM